MIGRLAPADDVAVDDALELAAEETVAAYVKAFRRRIDTNAKRNAPAFKNPEPNALLALATVWRSRGVGSEEAKNQALDMLVSVSRPLLEHDEGHSVALDVAGVAWSDSYGLLPVRRPPAEQLEWVLESGNDRRAVKGVMGSAWRLAFLASTIPLLDWQHRPVAEKGLDRWAQYLVSKLEAAEQPAGGEAGSASVHARLAFALSLGGLRAGAEEILDGARRELEIAMAQQPAEAAAAADDVSSAVLAQLGAASAALGDVAAAQNYLRPLLESRRNEETLLVSAGGSDEVARDEFSPWIMLGLLPLLGSEAPRPRGLMRRAFRLGPSHRSA